MAKRSYVLTAVIAIVFVVAPASYLWIGSSLVRAPASLSSSVPNELADSPGFSPGKAADDREPTTRYGCGIERWAIKTGTDADARIVKMKRVVSTSISHLIGLRKPSSLPDSSRIRPVETTVWSMRTQLTAYKQEADSDYHLIIASPSGQTMILEIPSPKCVGTSSPFLKKITAARASFSRHFAVSPEWHFTHTWISVTGVGFFDHVHDVDGQAANGIELHPVLGIRLH
jgi:hypothetical protein